MSKLLKGALAFMLAAGTAGCMSNMEDDDMGATASASATTAGTVMVGGAPMYPTKTIVANAVNSKDHTTLVAAVKAAGLVDTLNSPGPFTVFAPVNAAFDRLPAGTVDTLLKPENKAQLTKVLTYHVVPGRKTAADIMADIKAGGGTATYTTAAGGTIRASMEGNNVVIWDANNNKSYVTQSNVMQSNGVIHVVNGVLLPA